MRPSKPLLIAGIPIAGFALSYHAQSASAWTTAPSSAAAPSMSHSSRNHRSARGHHSRSSPMRTLQRSVRSSTSLQSAMEDTISTLDLPPELAMMTQAFATIPDEKTRHKQLLYMADKLPAVGDEVRIKENKVPGCLSTVFVDCTVEKKVASSSSEAVEGGAQGQGEEQYIEEQYIINYQGDSDGLLTKGLLALLIRGLSGSTVGQIEKVEPTFIQAAKISQTLTPGRNNGFLNMLGVMKKKAREAVDREIEGGGSADGGSEDDVNGDATGNGIITTFTPIEGKPMYNAILNLLITLLKPTSITLTDNSHQHAGHAGSKGWAESGESHFSLEVVAEAFGGLSLVKRHQLIYMVLGSQGIMEKIHALQISAKSPGEVEVEVDVVGEVNVDDE